MISASRKMVPLIERLKSKRRNRLSEGEMLRRVLVMAERFERDCDIWNGKPSPQVAAAKSAVASSRGRYGRTRDLLQKMIESQT